VSAAVARHHPGWRTISRQEPIPIPVIVRLFRPVTKMPSTQWSRPMAADGCSMVARMPRYAPAASGIRSATQIPATGQNSSSRHVPTLFDSSSRIINEQSSGLLIRGYRDSPLAARSRQTRVFHSGPYLCPSPVVAVAENPPALVEAHRTCTPYTAVHLRYICALTSSYA
jgi:hypothetical protein